MEPVDPKEVVSKGKVRRATFSDFNAVMEIHDNVYDGFDYMAAMFHIFMQSKHHAIYVYEVKGKLIALQNYFFYPDPDGLVNTMSGRIHPSFQGYGLSHPERNPILHQFRKDYPNISRSLGDAVLTPKVESYSKQLDHQIWNILLYKIPDHRLITALLNLKVETVDPTKSHWLSYADAIQWISRNDELVEFLSRYSKSYTPVGHGWLPTPVSKSGLRQIFSMSNTWISFNNPGTGISFSAESQTESGSSYERQNQESKTWTRKESGNDISGLSFSSCIQCKYGLSISFHFYGDDECVCVNHIYSHLRHYFSIAKDDVGIGFQMNFALNLDSNKIEERLNEVLGGRSNTGHFGPKQAILFCHPLSSLHSKM